jgi:hypothetical protein
MTRPEPEKLRRGKAFHRAVQDDWTHTAQGEVDIEKAVKKPSGRRGRIDILAGANTTGSVGVGEVKATDWNRMTESSLRRNVTRQARQIWDYIESQLAQEKEVSPGVIFPTRPESIERLNLIEALFEEHGIAVVWYDESLEERRSRAGLSPIESDVADQAI